VWFGLCREVFYCLVGLVWGLFEGFGRLFFDVVWVVLGVGWGGCMCVW